MLRKTISKASIKLNIVLFIKKNLNQNIKKLLYMEIDKDAIDELLFRKYK